MEQENKELLLKDLCTRLPYKVKVCLYKKEVCIFMGIDGDKVYLNVDSDSFYIENIKPYLRPLSSMTDEERAERIGLLWELEGHIDENVTYKYQDWLNKHHFDYRGLIPMGLAIDCTNLNIY